MKEEKIPETNAASVAFRTIAHFYDPDDPSPADHRELSDRVEGQIFRQVLDVPGVSREKLPDMLEIRIPARDVPPEGPDTIIAAIRAHFLNRAGEVERDTKLTGKIGLREFRLTIAVCLLSFAGIAVCVQFKGEPVAEIIQQVLVIFCWVTIWQPFQSFVFDRWTQSRRAIDNIPGYRRDGYQSQTGMNRLWAEDKKILLKLHTKAGFSPRYSSKTHIFDFLCWDYSVQLWGVAFPTIL